MGKEQPIPRDKVVGLVMLIAITFVVLSMVTLGPSRVRLGHHEQPPAQQSTVQRVSSP